jgi:hypothetical protein
MLDMLDMLDTPRAELCDAPDSYWEKIRTVA